MKRILLSFIGFLLFTNVISQTPGWQWAVGGGLAGNDDVGNAVALDNSGNLYSTGSFGSATLTIGTASVTRLGLGNVYVVKQDGNGNVIWLKSFGGINAGTGGGVGTSICNDASGNTYVAGYYFSKLVLGTNTLTALDTTATNIGDIFVTKLDASGNVMWAASAGGTMADYAYGLAVDGSGNVYVTGAFRSRYFFAGTNTVVSTNNGSPFITTDVVIAKYSSTGVLTWVKSAGTAGVDEGKGINIDAAGNVLVAGNYYMGNIALGTTTLTGTSAFNLFVAKYNGAGTEQWAKTATGAGSGSINHFAYGVSSDNSNNVYITGAFNASTLTLGASSVTNSINSGYDLMIAKLDATGNTQWLKGMAGTGNAYGYGISTDGNGNSYITGYFDGMNVVLDTYTLTNTNGGGNNEDVFLAKYDASGVVLWATKAGSGMRDISYGVGSNQNGDVGITGKITTTTTIGTATLLCGGGGSIPDLFVAKIGVPAGVTENSISENTRLFPNPNSGFFKLQMTGMKAAVMSLADVMGRSVHQQVLTEGTNDVRLPLVGQGIYFYSIFEEGRLIRSGKIFIE